MYTVIPNLLTSSELITLQNEFESTATPWRPERGVTGNIKRIYKNLVFQSLFDKFTPILNEVYQRELAPTYSYARKYSQDCKLHPHLDRPACEFSLSVNIASSDDTVPWSFNFYNENNERVEVFLNPGDGVCYKGLEVSHGRNECPVEWYTQAFYHWVDKNGVYGYLINDNRDIIIESN